MQNMCHGIFKVPWFALVLDIRVTYDLVMVDFHRLGADLLVRTTCFKKNTMHRKHRRIQDLSDRKNKCDWNQ